jgi:hypothetical protein
MNRRHLNTGSKTLFVVEGIRSAVLVTARGKRLSRSHLNFASPDDALAWCKQNRATLVYTHAADPSSN